MANFVSFLDLTSPSSPPRKGRCHDQFPSVLMDSILPYPSSTTIVRVKCKNNKNKITNYYNTIIKINNKKIMITIIIKNILKYNYSNNRKTNMFRPTKCDKWYNC